MLAILRHKGILNKYLCKNFFKENGMLFLFCGDLNIEEEEEDE